MPWLKAVLEGVEALVLSAVSGIQGDRIRKIDVLMGEKVGRHV
jgi:hypothetical protein